MNTDEDIQAAINNAGDIGCTYIPDITESEYISMLSHIDMIMDRDPDPTSPDGIQLAALVSIVEQYESKHYPSLSQEPSTPVYDSYPLWQLLHEEHGLILLNCEIEDIINVATPIIEQRKKSLPEDAAANSDVRRIAIERDRMRHALQKIEAESHDARAVDYAEAALR
jgi:hypothetical protein